MGKRGKSRGKFISLAQKQSRDNNINGHIKAQESVLQSLSALFGDVLSEEIIHESAEQCLYDLEEATAALSLLCQTEPSPSVPDPEEDLKLLQDLFPAADRNSIRSVLASNGGNVDEALETLLTVTAFEDDSNATELGSSDDFEALTKEEAAFVYSFAHADAIGDVDHKSSAAASPPTFPPPLQLLRASSFHSDLDIEQLVRQCSGDAVEERKTEPIGPISASTTTPQQSSPSWSCPRCTCDNDMTSRKCVACGGIGPHSQRQPKAASKPMSLREIQAEEEAKMRSLRDISVLASPTAGASVTGAVDLSALAAEVGTGSTGFNKWGSADGVDYATKLKIDKMVQHFPTIDRQSALSVYIHNGRNFEAAVQYLSSHTGQDGLLRSDLLNIKTHDRVRKVKLPDGTVQTQIVTAKGVVRPNEDSLGALVSGGSVDGTTSQKALYDSAREATFQLAERKKILCREAARAHAQGNRTRAGDLARQAKVLDDEIRKGNLQAMTSIFKRANMRNNVLNKVDLHGLHVTEALQVLSKIVRRVRQMMSQAAANSTRNLTVVTGKNERSTGGVARLRPAVIAFCKQSNLVYECPSGGEVVIRIEARP